MGVVSCVDVIVVADDCWIMLMASCLLLAGKSPRSLGFELSLPSTHPSPDDCTPRRSTESYITTLIPLLVPHPCVLGSGMLSLLELGCGTGANFTFYLPSCRVTCVNFEKFLIKSIVENQHVQFERFVVAAAENMHPVADGSTDAVVCTPVLCSVKNRERILQEVCRVLRGEGREVWGGR